MFASAEYATKYLYFATPETICLFVNLYILAVLVLNPPDDNFLADAKRAHKIFDMLLERGTELDLLILGARVDSADKKLYTKMKEANVKFVGFGIESGDWH